MLRYLQAKQSFSLKLNEEFCLVTPPSLGKSHLQATESCCQVIIMSRMTVTSDSQSRKSNRSFKRR